MQGLACRIEFLVSSRLLELEVVGNSEKVDNVLVGQNPARAQWLGPG